MKPPRLLLCLSALAVQFHLPPLCPAAARPNIVVIMADDLGWRDLHCYGNAGVDTPHLDQLAAEGMKFTDAYAASPVCTPTRAAMMTGQAPARLGITNHAPGNPDGFSLPGSNLQEPPTLRHLPLSHTTIAERLSAAGYATAHIGKWHLSHVARVGQDGLTEPGLRPEHQGFSLNVGGCDLGGPPSYFAPYRISALKDGPKGEFLPERLADEAIQFIRAPRDGPFFLNWWPYCVHYPMQSTDALIAKYKRRPEVKDPVYAAMIEAMDSAIGRFLKALEEAGLRDSTLILFKSDNGGFHGVNKPLRGIKGMLYEGGIRVPWIVRWPGRVQPGSTCGTPVISMDCHPTLLEAAGLPPTPDHPLDGQSLLPLLTQSSGFAREALFFHYPNYAFHKQNRLGSAVREGDFKLIRHDDTGEAELYNLAADIGESKNIARESPGTAQRLTAKLDAWLRETGARLPVKTKAAVTKAGKASSGARFDPVVRKIEGWTVHVDPALLDGGHRQEGARALAMLANHLQRVAILLPPGPLEKMRGLEIWIEHRHPTLESMQYHPGLDWLVQNGLDPRLHQKVHIPRAADLLSRDQMLKHPAVILHELAHAYHDQVLGFDHPGIIAAYEKAAATGAYQRVLDHEGRQVRHYGLTDPKEYFAEGTEAFFYRNDFFPFVRAELKQHDPVLHDLLMKIWEEPAAPQPPRQR